MTILEKIVKDKRMEIDLKKSIIPMKQLEHSTLFDRKPISLVEKLKDSSSGIIAEHKRRSPSKSIILKDCTY